MIIGIGTDIVEIARITKFIERWGPRFSRKILGSEEVQVFADRLEQASFVARQFAAKEAISKSLGTGMRGIAFSDIEVLRDLAGAPFVTFSANGNKVVQSKGVGTIHVSISDEKKYAIAYAVAESSLVVHL
jgi:holo-[acyl-carrier protein] synthase